MTEGWEEVVLGDLATVFDGPHATPAKTDSGPWYLSISSLVDGRLDLSASAHLSEADFPRWTKRVSPLPGDTLFSYETRLGEAAHWRLTDRAAIGRRMGILRPKEGVDPRFLTYAFLGPQFQEEIRKRSIRGATVDRIPIAELPSWPIVVPGPTEQRCIGAALGALDDLIETNRQVADSGEALAIAVVALATENVALGELATDLRSQTTTPVGPTDLYSLPAFDVGRLPERLDGSEIKSNKTRLDDSVVLVSRLNPHIPRVWMAYPTPGVLSAASTEFVPLLGSSAATEEVWAVCAGTDYVIQMMGLVTGTTGSHQRVDKDALLTLTVPDVRTLTDSERRAVVALVREAYASRSAASDLARFRDELLPLLLSGRLSVREAAA